MHIKMSRRKQLHPKPLNTGDCSETTEEMTIDSRDSKELKPNNLLTDDHNRSENDPQSNLTEETDIEMTDSHTEEEEVSMFTKTESPSDNMIQSPTSPASSHETNSTDSVRTAERLPVNDHLKTEPNIEEENSEDNNAATERAETPAPHEVSFTNKSPSPGKASSRENSVSSSPSNTIPKLRLNTLLASDPALKPDAKDLKAIHEESKSKNRISQLSASPALGKQEDLKSNILGVQPLQQQQQLLDPVAPVDIPPRIKVFMCLPCGIGFSSPSTLEAHQKYYCQHRNKDAEEDGTSLSSAIAEKSGNINATTNANKSTAVNTGVNASGNSGEPTSKAIKTGKQYACPQCSYSADKKVSLNRHMRMHQTSPAPSSNASNGGALEDSSSQQIDRYCSECDIRFNNVKTYHAHKLHYCSSRRTDGQITPKLEVNTASAMKTPGLSGEISPQTSRTKTPTPAMVAAAAAAAAAASLQPAPQPFLALPTNPILIIPYSLVRAASLIPGPLTSVTSNIANPESTCFTLDNGALKPLATALNLNTMNPNPNNSPPASASTVAQMPTTDVPRTQHSSNNESLLTEKNASRSTDVEEPATNKRKEVALRESAPLDLSLRRSPIAAILQKQRFRSASAFLEQRNAEQHRYNLEVLLEAGKENLSLDESSSVTPEQIVCAPSLPNSPSMSPSPKRRTISPRSSGAGSTASMSPPANVSTASLAAAASNMLENLPLINPLLAKQNLELALKLSAAAAAAVNSSTANVPTVSTPAELAAAAVVAAGKTSLLGLPMLPGTAAKTSTPGSSGQPQIYVKQGVSKCKECNIVFCKYENYLAHKQHYCSARNQDIAGGEVDLKASRTSPIAASASTAETTPVAYQQLICAACGIKYTSLDNLRAHQNYYCPKGGGAAAVAATTITDAVQIALPKEKCSKCKTVHEVGLPCPPPPALQQSPAATQQHPINAATGSSSTNAAASGAHQNIYKCPVCDAISLTASESRKHMETHGTVKAFRCSICRYKGNTLRGMRTHIRMHFDKKTSDFNEEHYMSCILEDENIEIPSAATVQQQQQQQLQQAAAVAAAAAGLQQQQQQVFNCDICNYSSTYKGNVLRHMKLVHPHVAINSPSLSPVADDYENADAASLGSSLNGDNGVHSFNIVKSEPVEHTTSAIVSNMKTMASANYSNLHDNNNSPIPIQPPPLLQSTVTPTSNELTAHIKTEPMDVSVDIENATTTTMPHPLQALGSPAIGPPPPLLNTATDDNTVNMVNAAAAALNQKYCQTCDISFNYMKTYLAHKQFYCKSKLLRPEANDSPSPNANIMPAVVQSPNALLLQKNKENLQQEAAI